MGFSLSPLPFPGLLGTLYVLVQVPTPDEPVRSYLFPASRTVKATLSLPFVPLSLHTVSAAHM